MTNKVGEYVWTNADFLGEGSFGKVYKGKHEKTGQIVAVKCIAKKLLNNQMMVEMLKKEIGVMKELTSPNVVKMFAVDENQETVFIVLEFCPDGDLDKFIKKKWRNAQGIDCSRCDEATDGWIQKSGQSGLYSSRYQAS